MCRCIAIWVSVVATVFSGGAQAATTASPPVDCQHTRDSPETTICNDETLRARDRAIAAAYDRLLPRYRGEDRTTFATGQRLWQVEVNDCRNLTDPKLIQTCIATRFSEREALLAKLEVDPANLATSVADYSLVTPAYLLKFAHQYDGKTVRVSGGIIIEACNAKKKRSLKGHLDHVLEVRFKSLPENEIEFLCEKNPVSWWAGTVRFDHGQPYLYATDVLGMELP
jgi:uncharacterized protein